MRFIDENVKNINIVLFKNTLKTWNFNVIVFVHVHIWFNWFNWRNAQLSKPFKIKSTFYYKFDVCLLRLNGAWTIVVLVSVSIMLNTLVYWFITSNNDTSINHTIASVNQSNANTSTPIISTAQKMNTYHIYDLLQCQPKAYL